MNLLTLNKVIFNLSKAKAKSSIFLSVLED